MREKKFTPGPWVEGYGEGLTGPTTPTCAAVFCGGEDWDYAVVSKGMETIAAIPSQVRDNSDCLATANLIAAAPELLEALESFVETYVNTYGLAGAYDTVLVKAQVAIAKAYGEDV